jgi:hypothetical protein
MMFLINNEAVCMKQYNNTGEGRRIHAQRGFERLIWVFRRLDHGQRILSAIGHMLIRVLYANVTNWFVLQKVCQKELSFLLFVYLFMFYCCRRIRKIAKSDDQLRHVCLSICVPSIHLYVRLSVLPTVFPSVYLSTRMEQLGFHWTKFDNIFYLCIFAENLSRNFKFH